MRRTLSLLTLSILIAFPLGVAAVTPAAASVSPFGGVIKLPVVGSFESSCPTVPIVTAQGQIVLNVHWFFIPGGRVSGTLHYANVDITGTAPDGTVYHLVGASSDIGISSPNSATVVRSALMFSFIGDGASPNAVLVVTAGFTIHPDGTVTGSVDNMVVKCT
jgi:hypothetical protein